MQTYTESHNVYSSEHGVYVEQDAVVDHVPAGHLHPEGHGLFLVRCTLGECEYRTDKPETKAYTLRKFRKHLGRKHS